MKSETCVRNSTFPCTLTTDPYDRARAEPDNSNQACNIQGVSLTEFHRWHIKYPVIPCLPLLCVCVCVMLPSFADDAIEEGSGGVVGAA